MTDRTISEAELARTLDLSAQQLADLEKTIVGLAIARFSPQPGATAIPATLGGAQTLLRTLVGDRFKHA